MTTVAIHQPNYLPWLGYFRKIAQCDTFVFFDNAELPQGKSFVSRNAIKTPTGRHWITVPIVKHRRAIAEIKIADQYWRTKHVKTLEASYAKAPHRHLIDQILAPILRHEYEYVADLNIALIRAIADAIGIENVEYVRATDLDLATTGKEAIPEILSRLDAQCYVTGTGVGTQRSIDPEAFAKLGIDIEYLSSVFPEYPQLYPPFEPNLSAVDALLNLGPEHTRALFDQSPTEAI